MNTEMFEGDVEWVKLSPSAIYKCHNGQYIDLERIVSISEIERNENSYSKQWAIYVYFQLKEEPIRIPLTGYDYYKTGLDNDETWNNKISCMDREEKIREKERQTIIDVWTKYKNRKDRNDNNN